MEELQRLYPDAADGYTLIALARFFRLAGNSGEVVRILRRVPDPPQSNEHVCLTATNILLETGEIAEAERRLAGIATSTSPAAWTARIRAAVMGGNHDLLRASLEGCDLSTIPEWVFCEAAYRLVKPSEVATDVMIAAEKLIRVGLGQTSRTSESALLAEMHIVIQRRQFAEMEVLFDRVKATPLAKNKNILIRQVEYLCLSDRTDEGLAIYRDELRDTTFGKWEGLSVINMLSEAKQWREAGEIILRHIEQGFGFGAAAHSSMRVVRRAGLHGAIAQLVSSGRVDMASREDDLAAFLALVQEDYILVQSANALTGHTFISAGAAPRLRSNGLLSAGPVTEDQTSCLFLCTNRSYFLSLLTFLCSFFGQSPQTSAIVYVFLDKDVPRNWQPAVTIVAARFGRSVEIVTEEQFLPDGIVHKADYGFFAGGGGLSRAAYFRVYAARYLLTTGKFLRALYTDTDIVCRGDLTALVNIDLGGRPIAAKIEDSSREVRDAAERNAIDPYRYFNSGVLVFDFAHPDAATGIDAAIRISETEPDRLIFHDQCALNIAFTHQFSELPAAFNFFLRPNRERNGFIEDAILLHYLDKPKPWDIVFDRTYREEWRVWAMYLSMVVPPQLQQQNG